MEEKKFILSLDVGSTVIRAFVYDEEANVIGKSSSTVSLLFPQTGRVEQDPHELVNHCKVALQKAIEKSKVDLHSIKCLGITTQRSSFLTWNKQNGQPVHNIITWQDTRSEAIAHKANQSYTVYALQNTAKFLWYFTRQERLASASGLKFNSILSCCGLAWVLQNIPEAQKLQSEGNLCFGTLDSWILYNFTDRKIHATEYSNISATGLWDPFDMGWNVWAFRILNLPFNVLPEVKDTICHFGDCIPSVFGEKNIISIPITAVAADQSAATFGQCCFSKGDTKCTIGTGCFVDINTGNQPYASKQGLYPLVGWKFGKEVSFLIEGTQPTAGNLIEWAIEFGLFDAPEKSEELASSVPDTNGCYFVPALKGLIHPYHDGSARGSALGINRSTRKEHVVRAMLEGIAYSIKDLILTIEEDIPVPINCIKFNGGVSQNNFVLQFSADILNRKIIKSQDYEMTAQGIAFMAGLGGGVWKSKEELTKLKTGVKEFVPNPQKMTGNQRKEKYEKWKDAVSRSLNWED